MGIEEIIVQAIREGSIDEAYRETYREIYAKAYQEAYKEAYDKGYQEGSKGRPGRRVCVGNKDHPITKEKSHRFPGIGNAEFSYRKS